MVNLSKIENFSIKKLPTITTTNAAAAAAGDETPEASSAVGNELGNGEEVSLPHPTIYRWSE